MTNEEIDKLEAGPKLDELIAEQVMGCPLIELKTRYAEYNEDWSPSENIADAWEVVEKLKKSGWCLSLLDGDWSNDERGTWCADFSNKKIDCSADITESQGATAPLAICRAALKAVDLRI